MGSEATGSEPSSDSMEDSVILGCVRLGDTSKFVDADVKRLIELWEMFKNGYDSTDFTRIDKRLESLLICTSRLIFSVEYTRHISSQCKQDLEVIISSCGETFSDSPHRQRLCKGICTILKDPWKSGSFYNFVNGSIPKKEAAKTLWETEGWLVLEKRIEYMTTLFKTTKALGRLGSALGVLVEKGHEIFQSDAQNNSADTNSAFNPNVFTYQKYVEYLGVYAILSYKKIVDTKIMETWCKNTLLDVISSLTEKISGKECERIFPKLVLWNDVAEVPIHLAKEATCDALKSVNGLLLEEFFRKWLELSKCTSNGMEKPEMESPIDEILTLGMKQVYNTNNIYKIANATIQWMGKTPFTRGKCVELFMMAMSRDMDEIESLKTSQQEETDVIDSLNKKLSFRYLDLTKFFKDCPKTAVQCLLTAFSLNPCPELYNILFPCSLDESEDVNMKTDNQDSDMMLNNYCNELKEIDFTNCELVVRDMVEDSDLDANLRTDLEILIENPRYKGLQTIPKENMISLCKKLLDSKSVTVIENKKLDHLDVDYEMYKDLKPQYDPEDDGIEKGYRHGERRGRPMLKSKAISRNIIAKKKAIKRARKLDPTQRRKGRPPKVKLPGNDQPKPVSAASRKAFEQLRQMPNICLLSNPWVANNTTGGFYAEFYHTCLRQNDPLYREKSYGRNFENEARLINSVERQMFQRNGRTGTHGIGESHPASSSSNSIEGSEGMLINEAVGFPVTPSNQLVPANPVSEVTTPMPEAGMHLPNTPLPNDASQILANNVETVPQQCSFFEDPFGGAMRRLVWKYHHFQRQRSIESSAATNLPIVKKQPTKQLSTNTGKKTRKPLIEPDTKKTKMKKPKMENLRNRTRKHSENMIEEIKPPHEDDVDSEDKNDNTISDDTGIKTDANEEGDTVGSTHQTNSPVSEQISATPLPQPEPPKPIFAGAFQIMGTYNKGDKPESSETLSDVITGSPAPIEHHGRSTNINNHPSPEQLKKWDATLSTVSTGQVNPLLPSLPLPTSKPVQNTTLFAPTTSKPLEHLHNIQKPLRTYSSSTGKHKRRLLVVKSSWSVSENEKLEAYKSAMPIPTMTNDVSVFPNQNNVSPASVNQSPSTLVSDYDRTQNLATAESTVETSPELYSILRPEISCTDNQSSLSVLHADSNIGTIDQVIAPQVPEITAASVSSTLTSCTVFSKRETSLPVNITDKVVSHQASFAELPGLEANSGSDKTRQDHILLNNSMVNNVAMEVDSNLEEVETAGNDGILPSTNVIGSVPVSKEQAAQTGTESQMTKEMITVFDANSEISPPTPNRQNHSKNNEQHIEESQTAPNKTPPENSSDVQVTKHKQTFSIFQPKVQSHLLRLASLFSKKAVTKVDTNTIEGSLKTQQASPVLTASMNAKTNEHNSQQAGNGPGCGDVAHKKEDIQCDIEKISGILSDERLEGKASEIQDSNLPPNSNIANKGEILVDSQSGGTKENENVNFPNPILAAHQQNETPSAKQGILVSVEDKNLPLPSAPLNIHQNKKMRNNSDNPVDPEADQFVQDSNDAFVLEPNSADNTLIEAKNIKVLPPLDDHSLASRSLETEIVNDERRSETDEVLLDTIKLLSTNINPQEEAVAVWQKSNSESSGSDCDCIAPLPEIEDPQISLSCSPENHKSSDMQSCELSSHNYDAIETEAMGCILYMLDILENETLSETSDASIESTSAEEGFTTEDDCAVQVSNESLSLDKINTGRDHDDSFDSKQNNEDVQLCTLENVKEENCECTESIEALKSPPTASDKQSLLHDDPSEIQSSQDTSLTEESDAEIICLDDEEDEDANIGSKEPIPELFDKNKQQSPTKCQEKEQAPDSSDGDTHSKLRQVTSLLLPHNTPAPDTDTTSPPRPLTPVEKLEHIINTKLKGKKRRRPYEEEDEKIKVADSVVKHVRSYGERLRKLVVCVVKLDRLSPHDDTVPKKVKDQLLSYSVKRSTRLKKKKMRTVLELKNVFEEPNSDTTTDDESLTDDQIQCDADSDSDIQIIEEIPAPVPSSKDDELEVLINVSRISSNPDSRVENLKSSLQTAELCERPPVKRRVPYSSNSRKGASKVQGASSSVQAANSLKRQKLEESSLNEEQSNKEMILDDCLDSQSSLSTEVEDDEDLPENGLDSSEIPNPYEVLPVFTEPISSDHDVETIEDEDPLAQDESVVPADVQYDRDGSLSAVIPTVNPIEESDDEDYDGRLNAMNGSATEDGRGEEALFPTVTVEADFAQTVPAAEQNGMCPEQIIGIGNLQDKNRSVAKANFVDDDDESSSSDIEIIHIEPSAAVNSRRQENLPINCSPSHLATNSNLKKVTPQGRKTSNSSCRSTRLTTEQSTISPSSPSPMDENSVIQESIEDAQVTDRFSAAANQEPESNVATTTCLSEQEPTCTNDNVYILPDSDSEEQQCFSARMCINQNIDDTETLEGHVSESNEDKTPSSVEFHEKTTAAICNQESSDSITEIFPPNEFAQNLQEREVESSMSPTMERPNIVDDVPVESFDAEMVDDHQHVVSGQTVEVSKFHNTHGFDEGLDTASTKTPTIPQDTDESQEHDNDAIDLIGQEFDSSSVEKDGESEDRQNACNNSEESSVNICHPMVLVSKEESQEGVTPPNDQNDIAEAVVTNPLRNEVREVDSAEISMVEYHAREKEVDNSNKESDRSQMQEGDTGTSENQDNNEEICLDDDNELPSNNTQNKNSSPKIVLEKEKNVFQTSGRIGRDENESEDTNTMQRRTEYDLEENENSKVRELIPKSVIQDDATTDKVVVEDSNATTTQDDFWSECGLEDIYPTKGIKHGDGDVGVALEEIAGPSRYTENESHVPNSIITLQKPDSPEIPRLTPETNAYESFWHSDDEPPMLENEGEFDCN